MAYNISTVTARDKLKARRDPYWARVEKGIYLGYRKMNHTTEGAWLMRWMDDDGKQQWKRLGHFSDLPPNQRFDAAKRAAEALKEHIGKGGTKEEITIGEACNRCVQWYKDASRDAAAKDAEARYKRWVHSDKKFANISLAKLTPGHVQDWRTKLVKAPLIEQDCKKERKRARAQSTVNRDMAALKVALNLALTDGYATSDFAWATKLKPTKNATGRRNVYLDPEQRRALIASAQADLALLLRGMSALPMRPGAIAALTVANFDMRLGILTIGKDKTGKGRSFKLPPSICNFFAEQSKDKLPTAPLFSRANGSAWNKDAWKGPFKDAAKAAGLPTEAVAYALRHAAITDLIAVHGVDLLTVSKLSATSLAMIEKHYGHLQHAKATEALGKLAIS